MKKFTKICLILSGALFCIGVALCVIGVTWGKANGSFDSVYSDYKSRIGGRFLHRVLDRLDIEDGDYDYNYDYSYNYNYNGKKHEHSSSTGNDQYEADEINNLEINVSSGILKIEKTDENKIIVENQSNRVRLDRDEDTLSVNLISGKEADETIIYVPDTKEFQEVEMNMTAGIISVEKLSAVEMDIDVNAGKLEMTNPLEVFMLNVSVEKGDVQIDLAGVKEDYNYTLENSSGEMVVAGEVVEKAGIADPEESFVDNGASKEIDLECHMGKINVSFQETL